jgi:hypothetical protein
MASPHVGDYGTPIILTIYKQDNTILDISATGSRVVYLINPSGSRIQKVGDLVTDGTDGKMQYSLENGDLNVEGQWKIQGYVIFTSGSGFYTDVQGLLVLPNE